MILRMARPLIVMIGIALAAASLVTPPAVAQNSSPTPPGGMTPPPPPPDMCGGVWSDPQYPFDGYPNGWRRDLYHRNCAPSGNSSFSVTYWADGTTVHFCIPPGGTAYIGPQFAPSTPPWFQGWHGIIWGFGPGQPSCEPPPSPPAPPPLGPPQAPIPDLPEVTVSGIVTTEVSTGGATRPLAGAQYRLRYYGWNGPAAESGIVDPQWHPIRDGIGGTGNPVEGYLDDQGRFTLDFVYPQPHQLPDGTHWLGCPEPENSVPFEQTYACAPDELVLEIYPRDEAGSVTVREPGQSEVRPAHTIELGQFFDPGAPTTHNADSAAALTYRAAHNVKDLTTTLPADQRLGPITIQLQDDTSAGYHPGTRTVDVPAAWAGDSDVEFHTAAAYLHDLLGEDYPRVPDGCDTTTLADDTDPLCAWVAGFAAAVADAAEHTGDQATLRLNGTTTFDVESCDVHDGPTALPCPEGPNVAARVAAAVRDLTDPTDETDNGFTDTAHRPFAALAGVVAGSRPLDVSGFWDAWRTENPDTSRLVMFMNTLEYTDLQDENEAPFVIGDWRQVECDSCRDGDLQSVDPYSGGERRWELGRRLPGSGVYDLWVRLPAGQPTDERQSSYEIHTFDGERQVAVLDQTAAADGWVNLRPDGIRIDAADFYGFAVVPVAPGTGDLIADAVLIAPHEGTPPGDTLAPVHVTGTVTTGVSDSFTVARDLGGAFFELLYEGHDGSQDSPVQLRPVLASTGPNGEPAGNPVTGYLDAGGGYDLRFVYPTDRRLADGTWWRGCERPLHPIDFQGSHACANDKLVLRVRPVNQDQSARVVVDETGELGIAIDVPLGEFFLRGPEETTVEATSAEARAYGAILSAEELVGDALPDTPIRIRNTMRPGVGGYFTGTTIVVGRAHALGSTPEHEIGHALAHSLGIQIGAPDCGYHGFFLTTNERCAYQEGLAEFFAAAIEQAKRPAADAGLPPILSNTYNMEHWQSRNVFDYQNAHAVEGRVAMALWDLYDAAAERTNGFTDRSAYPLTAIMDGIREGSNTFAGFAQAWRARHPGDEETMFLNTVLYAGVSDAGWVPMTTPRGTWTKAGCAPAACFGGSHQRSTGTASLTWNIDEMIKRDGRYDIWVKVPAAPGSDALYTVTTAGGPVKITVTQETAAQGWVNLRKEGFTMNVSGVSAVILSPGQKNPTGSVVADALVVVPHLG